MRGGSRAKIAPQRWSEPSLGSGASRGLRNAVTPSRDQQAPHASYHKHSEAGGVSKPGVASESYHRRGRLHHWLYDHPRLGFFVFLLICTCASGIVATYYLTMAVLNVTGATSALTHARSQYRVTRTLMQDMSRCTDGSEANALASVHLLVQAETHHWQQIIDANDRRLDDAQATTATCLAMVEARLNDALQWPAHPSQTRDSNATKMNTAISEEKLVCLAKGIHSLEGSALPLQVVARLQSKLNAAAVTSAWIASPGKDDKLSHTQTALTKEVLTTVNSWADAMESVTAAVHDQGLTAPIRVPEVPPLLQALSPTGDGRSGALVAAAAAVVNDSVLQKYVVQVISQLLSLDGGVEAVAEIIKDYSMALAQSAVNLAERDKAFRGLVNEYTNATMALSQQLAIEIDHTLKEITAIDDLRVQDDARLRRVQTLVATVGASLPNDRSSSIPVASIHASANASQSLKHHMLSLPTIRETSDTSWSTGDGSNTASNHTLVDNQADSWVLRSGAMDVTTVLTTLLTITDIHYTLSRLLDVVARLFTESYTELPPVDIREISTIQSMIDVWKAITCQHSFSSVIYTMLTDGMSVLELVVNFLLWVLLEVVGTATMVEWKRGFLRDCSIGALDDLAVRSEVSSASHVGAVMLDFLMHVLDPQSEPPWTPTTPTSASNFQKQIDTIRTRVHDAIVDENTKLSLELRAIGQNQTQRARELMKQVNTLAEVSRLPDTCASGTQQHDTSKQHEDQEATYTLANSQLKDDKTSCSLLDLERAFDPVEIDAFGTSPTSLLLDVDQIMQMTLEPLLSSMNATSACTSLVDMFPGSGSDGDSSSTGYSVDVVNQSLREIEHVHSCARTQSLYLTIAVWWIFIVLAITTRFIARMLVKAAGMWWWRYLSADRVQFMAFCFADGTTNKDQEPKLRKAVRRYLRDMKWRVCARLVSVAMAAASATVIIVLTLRSMTLPIPLNPYR